MKKVRLGIGIVAVIIGLLQIYVGFEGRTAGSSVPVFDLIVGVFFIALGAWFVFSAKRVQ